MSLHDLLGPSLTSEKRVRQGSPALRRVFDHDLYEVFVGLYPGGLLTTLVHYKQEQLRIMCRLGDAPAIPQEPQENDAWVLTAINLIKASARGPFHVIRDTKLECGRVLTLHDRAALKMAGVEIPRSAGRYRDVFGDSDSTSPSRTKILKQRPGTDE